MLQRCSQAMQRFPAIMQRSASCWTPCVATRACESHQNWPWSHNFSALHHCFNQIALASTPDKHSISLFICVTLFMFCLLCNMCSSFSSGFGSISSQLQQQRPIKSCFMKTEQTRRGARGGGRGVSRPDTLSGVFGWVSGVLPFHQLEVLLCAPVRPRTSSITSRPRTATMLEGQDLPTDRS